MLTVFRPSFEVVKEGWISEKSDHTRPIYWYLFVCSHQGPLKIKKLQPQKLVNFFFLVPVLMQTGDASLIRMLIASVRIWCQDFGMENEDFYLKVL